MEQAIYVVSKLFPIWLDLEATISLWYVHIYVYLYPVFVFRGCVTQLQEKSYIVQYWECTTESLYCPECHPSHWGEVLYSFMACGRKDFCSCPWDNEAVRAFWRRHSAGCPVCGWEGGLGYPWSITVCSASCKWLCCWPLVKNIILRGDRDSGAKARTRELSKYVGSQCLIMEEVIYRVRV